MGIKMWNYRVVHSSEGYEIREVYYDDINNIKAYSASPVAPFGEDLDELRRDLFHFAAALQHSVLEVGQLEAIHRSHDEDRRHDE